MDPDDVARLVEELKLSTEASKTIVVVPKEGTTSLRWRKQPVVGKIYDSRVVNRETLRSQLPRILQLRSEADIEIVGDNIFAIDFKSEADKNHTLRDGPWHFFRSLMMFKEITGLQHPSEVQFDIYSTWIQCHNLPLSCMQPDIIRRIGEKVGRVEEIDVNENGSCLGQFARIRVSRDINAPLQRCVSMADEGGREQRIVLIRYEKLPDFCFACGRVGHVIRHCREEGVNKIQCAYGHLMRAGRVVESRRQAWSTNTNAPSRERYGMSRLLEEKSEEEQGTEGSGNNNRGEEVMGDRQLTLIMEEGREAEGIIPHMQPADETTDGGMGGEKFEHIVKRQYVN